MRFKQYKDGSCDIEFSFRERINLFLKGKLILDDKSLKIFGDNLVRIVTEWQINFDKDLRKRLTSYDDKIKTK